MTKAPRPTTMIMLSTMVLCGKIPETSNPVFNTKSRSPKSTNVFTLGALTLISKSSSSYKNHLTAIPKRLCLILRSFL